MATSIKLINSQMILWLIIQLLIILFTMDSRTSDQAVFFWTTLPFLILNCIGVFIIILGKPKTGSILFLIGSVIFVPIGLIGTIGAKKILNKIQED